MIAPLNFQTLVELDTNPSGTANYVRLGDGISTITPSNNETVDTKSYLDDDGGMTDTITGFKNGYTFSGDRIIGNAAQDFIFDKIFSVGASRKTRLRVTMPNGAVKTGTVNIGIDSDGGGDASATAAIGFSLNFDGKPTLTVPQTAAALTATVAAGTATGSTKFTATPGVGNTLAYKVAATLTTPKSREYIADFQPYTSAADIPGVAVGQVLHMYELDAYYHLVKFASETLESGDIGA